LVLEREKIHQFNRFYLLFAIVISFAIPFLTFEIIKIVPVVQAIEPFNTIVTSSGLPENEFQEINAATTENINYTPNILWSLYGIISLLLLVRFGKNIWKLISKSKSNPIVKYNNATLVLIQEKTLPHTFLNSIFINFEDYNNRTIEDELYAHELVHVNQKHTLDILFIELLKVIFWFNPIFIFYKKAIQLNHEFLADETIVKTYNNVPFYQNLLLQKSRNIETIYLASNLNYSVTKKRLLMMTKSTSQKIAVLKKIAIVPILAVLIYFFCIEIVAKEKVISVNRDAASAVTVNDIKLDNSAISDKRRDNYYSGVYVKIIDERINRRDVTLYENLSLEDKRKYLNFIPEKRVETKIPAAEFEKLKTENNYVLIDGKASNKEKIKKYSSNDFSYYTKSSVYSKGEKNATKYHYALYTKSFFDKNIKNSHLHFTLDTVTIGHSIYRNSMKDKILKHLQIDTIVSQKTDSNEYNLFVTEKKEKKVIVIDAGHGGQDFGATNEEWNEKNLTSLIAKKIKEMHSDSNVEIHYTRTDDEFIALNDRTNLINNLKPDLVISLHINNNKNTTSSGFEIFISDKPDFLDKTKEFAEKLSTKLSKTQLRDRGLKFAPFFILKNSLCPSMVVELGFISNENDRKFITSEKGQIEIAKHIVDFISELK
jgi:N-acetylmuramoyl-L-alanine amidase